MIFPIILFLLFVALVLCAIGFFLEPVNPYLIIFSSVILLIMSAGILLEGIEIKTGDISVNATPDGNTTISIITQETISYSGSRVNYFALVAILISLYLAYFGIGEIISEKYGGSNVE